MKVTFRILGLVICGIAAFAGGIVSGLLSRNGELGRLIRRSR